MNKEELDGCAKHMQENDLINGYLISTAIGIGLGLLTIPIFIYFVF